MDIDFSQLTEYQRYKLMASLIVPRPIALVTTLGPDGTVNAAPFSMFNMVGEEPPIVMISLNRRDDASLKDTALNIVRTGEFVVHMADEAIAAQMHRCGEHHPPHVSELDVVGFTALPSKVVAPPRIAEAPVAFECTLFETMETASRQVFIGQVRWMHARDEQGLFTLFPGSRRPATAGQSRRVTLRVLKHAQGTQRRVARRGRPSRRVG